MLVKRFCDADLHYFSEKLQLCYDVALNLQQALTTAYDLLGLDLVIDYTQPPEIPLKAEDAAWAITLLHSAGLRP